MEENFVKYFSPYDNIYFALLIEIFIEKPNPIYPMMIQMFYSNLKSKGVSIISKIRKTNIIFPVEDFGVLNKIPLYGKAYYINSPDNFTNFDHVVAFGSFLINSMR